MRLSQKIIVTRSENDSSAFVQNACQRIGDLSLDDFLIEPLISLEYYDVQLPQFHEGDAVIVTSMNAARIFAHESFDKAWRDVPFYVVGEKSRDILLAAGASHIVECAPDVSSLMLTLPNCFEGRFIYFRGRDISFDIRRALSDVGQDIEEIICYEARTQNELTAQCLKVIRERNVCALTFLSKRTAQAFCDIVKEYGLDIFLGDVRFLCISEAVADVLHDVSGVCLITRTPDVDGMFGLIENI